MPREMWILPDQPMQFLLQYDGRNTDTDAGVRA